MNAEQNVNLKFKFIESVHSVNLTSKFNKTSGSLAQKVINLEDFGSNQGPISDIIFSFKKGNRMKILNDTYVIQDLVEFKGIKIENQINLTYSI